MSQIMYINYLIAIDYLNKLLETNIEEELKTIINNFIDFMQTGVDSYEYRPNNKTIPSFNVDDVAKEKALKTTLRVVKMEAYMCKDETQKEGLNKLEKYMRRLYVLNRIEKDKEERDL